MSHSNHVTLLQLAAAQLALSLKETEQPFDNLSKLFIEIVEGYNHIETLIGSENSEDIKQLKLLHNQTQGRVRNAIVDFQFYDRMTQRLQHIMATIQDAISCLNPDNGIDDAQWQHIFDNIEKSYTMREEIQLFNSIRNGVGFEQAIQSLIQKTFEKEAVEPEIELF
ncbi:MAG: hypothetical protein Q9M92_12485 [Enterobacterales bacterium]|nr:hypothetical protein [Enterobacterales bacterium]